jgi:hypothetical protein
MEFPGRAAREGVKTKRMAARVWDSSQTLTRSHYSVRARPRKTEREREGLRETEIERDK